jgi:hypothetical protein
MHVQVCKKMSLLSTIRLAAKLLKILCSDANIREQIKVFEGIRICLRYFISILNVHFCNDADVLI